MDGAFVLLILAIIVVFAAGFGAGYGVREYISRQRRALERERQMQQMTERAQSSEALAVLRTIGRMPS